MGWVKPFSRTSPWPGDGFYPSTQCRCSWGEFPWVIPFGWGPLADRVHPPVDWGVAVVENFVPHPSRDTPRLIGDIPG